MNASFADVDPATRLHDEMLLWVSEHVDELIERIQGAGPDEWPGTLVEELRDKAKANVRQLRDLIEASLEPRGRGAHAEPAQPVPGSTSGEYQAELKAALSRIDGWGLGEPPRKHRPAAGGAQLQVPIKHKKLLLGFVDVRVEYDEPVLSVSSAVYADFFSVLDLTLPTWRVDRVPTVVNFEVRPAIPSLVELIREVKTHRTYDDAREDAEKIYAVVSPDDRYAQVLESQGILFIKYEPS